ncbi:MAG TPA: protein kinase [Gemmatimonadales bacterium]|nr:protein kinase [Gemmatimonadales bacterium]
MPVSSATRPALGLGAKIFVAATLAVTAVLAVTFGLTSVQANRTADESIRHALAGVRRGVQAFLAGRTATFIGMSGVSAQVPQFRERLLRSSERSNVLDQAEEYRQLLGAAWVLVTNDRGILVARTDYPTETEIDLSHGALIANALSGDETSGAWLDERRRRLYQAIAVPLRASPDAAAQGVLVAAYAMDDTLAQAIKQATTTDVVFFALDTLGRPYIVGSTLPRDDVEPALAADTAAMGAIGGAGGAGGARDSAGTELSADVAGEHLIGLASPIRSAGGDAFGGFVAFRSHDRELGAFRALRRTIGFAVVLGLLLALATAYVLARQIAGPIRRLALATRRVQDGDYGVDIDVRSRDEIGVLSQAFKSLVEDLKEKAALVEYMTSASGAAATAQLKTTGRPSLASRGDLLRPGTLFANRYDVQELVGTGGMGVVYRAFDRELQEPVAIKTLRPEALAGDGVALERFKQEIRLARRIAHRNVVRTYDLGEVDGMYYLTMEYVEGTSLKQLITTRGRLPLPVTLTIGKQLCRALEVAHEQGVIHRDIKPQNMVVDPSGFLKVMDFGIARLANAPHGKGLTQEGMSIGTPDYMSPEQLSGMELDVRSDLYSAGVVLFECLTGRVPFEAESVYALIAKHLEGSAPDPRTLNPDVPEALARVILKAMAKEPADRYQTAGQMHDALAAIG